MPDSHNNIDSFDTFWTELLRIEYSFFSTDSIFKYKLAQIPTDKTIYIVAI